MHSTSLKKLPSCLAMSTFSDFQGFSECSPLITRAITTPDHQISISMMGARLLLCSTVFKDPSFDIFHPPLQTSPCDEKTVGLLVPCRRPPHTHHMHTHLTVLQASNIPDFCPHDSKEGKKQAGGHATKDGYCRGWRFKIQKGLTGSSWF